MFSFAVPAASADTLHNTDGSYVNRPFFRFKLDVRKSIFSPKNILPRNVFCFFSSRKEIVPPSFLFRRKEAKENQLRSSFPSSLLLLPPTRCTAYSMTLRDGHAEGINCSDVFFALATRTRAGIV